VGAAEALGGSTHDRLEYAICHERFAHPPLTPPFQGGPFLLRTQFNLASTGQPDGIG